MKSTIIKWILFSLFLMGVAIMCATQLKCISAPDQEYYDYKACYDAAYCRYCNAKANENVNDCGKDIDYCNKLRVKSICDKESNFNSCWHILR